jgi:hypothetical protein
VLVVRLWLVVLFVVGLGELGSSRSKTLCFVQTLACRLATAAPSLNLTHATHTQ